ncbi:MAG TPA: hypothetical protein VH309_00575 [Elusimicrobiota bacterium]|nr:hypothetical protein [Elusimicrobiota bacterium]
MIICQDTKAGFIGDIANDYARFSSVLGQAEAADDVQIATASV